MRKKWHWSLNSILGTIFTTIIVLFILLHITPSMAVRTAMFKNGFYREALTVKITRTDKHPDADATGDNGTLYVVSPKPKMNRQFADCDVWTDRYIVKSCGLSFAEINWWV